MLLLMNILSFLRVTIMVLLCMCRTESNFDEDRDEPVCSDLEDFPQQDTVSHCSDVQEKPQLSPLSTSTADCSLSEPIASRRTTSTPTTNKRPRKSDAVGDQLMKYLNERKAGKDEDEQFMLSFVPALKRLPADKRGMA